MLLLPDSTCNQEEQTNCRSSGEHTVAGSRVGLGGFKPTPFQKRYPCNPKTFWWGCVGARE